MRRLLSLILSVSLLLSLFLLPTEGHSAVADTAVETPAVQQLVTEFVSTYAARTPGSETEKRAAEYLAEHFMRYSLLDHRGNTPTGADSYLQSLQYTVNGVPTYSQNVVGIKKGSGTQKGFAVIGAHYDVGSDNVLDTAGNISAVSYGAFHSGSGVGAMLMLMEAMQDVSLPFDVYFCLFGSRYADLVGSRTFLSGLTEEQKKDMLIYIDLSSLGDGSNLYLYTDEVKRSHEAFIRTVAEEKGIAVAKSPADKGVSLSSVYYIPYMHDGFNCDVLSFMAEGIPVANLFSTAWGKNNKAGEGEVPRYLSVKHDTAEAMFQSGSAVRNMNAAVSLTVATLTHASFAESMVMSRESYYRYHGWLNGNIYLFVLVVLVVIGGGVTAFFYFRCKPKKADGEGGDSFEAPFGEEFETKER